MKLFKIASIVLAFTASSASIAGDVNGIQYNSVDFAYGTGSLEGGSGTSKTVFDRFKGTGVSGTYQLDNLLFKLVYESVKSNGVTIGSTAYNATTDLKITNYEIGYRFGMSTGFDLVTSVGHLTQKLTLKRSGVADRNDNSSGNKVALTAFNKLSDNLQSNVSFSRNSYEENTISAGILYKLNNSWGLRANYSNTTGDDNLKSNQTMFAISYLY